MLEALALVNVTSRLQQQAGHRSEGRADPRMSDKPTAFATFAPTG